MDTTTFAKKIKDKYPEYANMEDSALVQKVVEKYPVYKSQITDLQNVQQSQPDAISRITAGIKEKGQKVQEAIVGGGVYADKSSLERGVGATAQAFSAISNTVYNALPDNTRNALDKISGGVGKGFNYVVDKISNNPKLQEIAMSGDTKSLESALQVVSDLGLISGEILGAKGATDSVGKLTSGVESVATKIADTKVSTGAPKTKSAFMQFISPEVDDTVKTSLRKTPTSKFDEYVKTAEDASVDATKPSVYEKVATQMEDALKKQESQISSLAEQKSTVIQKAKNGLTDFSKETGQTILDINRALPDSSIAKSFIERLKSVKTKVDADKIIDELQNELYKGNKALTIPVGSTEDSILRRALGEYNTKLKSSLPGSYAKLNSELSKRIAIRDTLNTALGEVVDGVPVRGAGLVKQFFSPAGTKTKQLFQAIKDTTGIDLSQEAILARYVGDAFGDTKVRMLLDGVPTTKSGVLEKVVDFAVEKLGAKRALSEARKKGALEKARAITNPNNLK